MGRYVEEADGVLKSIVSKRVSLTAIKAGTSRTAQRILNALAERPQYSYELAKKLGVHEQKIYYHMRNLERGGLIRAERHEALNGAKYYRLTAPAFTVTLQEAQTSGAVRPSSQTYAGLIKPFINEGRAAFSIIVGSPDAHGPHMARGKDGSFAIDLALFLGSFLSERPPSVVKLDTEVKAEALRGNLIIIGGPIVNTVAGSVNDALPLRFVEEGRALYSEQSGTTYRDDEVGVIIKAPNPLRPKKEGSAILLIAGVTQAGTRAAMLALTSIPERIAATPQAIIRGIDRNSDGIVDDIEILEHGEGEQRQNSKQDVKA